MDNANAEIHSGQEPESMQALLTKSYLSVIRRAQKFPDNEDLARQARIAQNRLLKLDAHPPKRPMPFYVTRDGVASPSLSHRPRRDSTVKNHPAAL